MRTFHEQGRLRITFYGVGFRKVRSEKKVPRIAVFQTFCKRNPGNLFPELTPADTERRINL